MIDSNPRQLSERQLEGLQRIARQVERLLESRVANQRLDYVNGINRALLDSSRNMIGLMNTDGTLLEANATAIRLAGLQHNAVLNRPFWDTPWWQHSPELQQRVKQAIERAADGQRDSFRATHPAPDGSLVQVDFTLTPIFGDDGTVQFLVPEGMDVTAIEDALRELKQQTFTLRQSQFAVENASDAVFWIRADGSFSYANQQAANNLGYSRQELCTMTVSDINPTYPIEAWPGHWEETKKLGVLTFESFHQRRDGTLYDCLITKRFLSFEDEEFIFASVRDVTDQRQTERHSRMLAAQFEQIVESMPVAVVYADRDRRIRRVNPAFENLFGYAADDVHGEQTRMIYADPEAFEAQGRTRFNDEARRDTAAYEVQYRRNDGIVFEGETVGTRITDDRGATVAFLGLITDITDRKRSEQQLLDAKRVAEESERRFRALADSASPLTWTTELDSTCSWLNKRWLDYCGRPMESQVGHGWIETVHPEDREHVRAKYMAAFGQRAPFQFEYRLRRHDGDYRWFMVNATPRFDADGAFVGYVGMSFDNHETHLARVALEESEAELLEANSQLKQTIGDLEQFAYVASHDLKQPLRGIDNLAQWVIDDAAEVLPATSRDHLQRMRGRVERLDGLLDDLLRYSRAGRVRERVTVVDTEELIRSVTEVLGPPEPFTVRCTSPMPVVESERTPLEQIFRNLIGNAIKHRASDLGHVLVSASELNRWVTFCVEDNGPGIERQFHDRVFQMFSTLRPRDEVEGSGMGLALVRKLVESNGGQIWLESEPGRGATFSFTWPR